MAKNSLQENIIKMGDVISGEEQLKKEREKLVKEKEKAKERQDSIIRSRIEGKNLKLEIDEDNTTVVDNKVIQNIKLFEWIAPRRSEIMFDMKAFLMIVALALVFMLYLAILGNIGLMGVIIALLFLIYVAGTRKPLKVRHRITARGIDTPISVDENVLEGKQDFENKAKVQNSGVKSFKTNSEEKESKQSVDVINEKDEKEKEGDAGKLDEKDYLQEEIVTSKEDLFTSKLYEWYMLEDFCFYKKYDQHYLIVRTELRIPSKLIMLVEEKDIETIFMLLQEKLLYRDVRKENMITRLIDGEYISLEEI